MEVVVEFERCMEVGSVKQTLQKSKAKQLTVLVEMIYPLRFLVVISLRIRWGALVALLSGKVTLDEPGLRITHAWVSTIGLTVAWLGLMLAYSPVAG